MQRPRDFCIDVTGQAGVIQSGGPVERWKWKDKLSSWLLTNAFGDYSYESVPLKLFPLKFVSYDEEIRYLEWRKGREGISFGMMASGLMLLVLAAFWALYQVGAKKLAVLFMELKSGFLNISMTIAVTALVFFIIANGIIPNRACHFTAEVFASVMLYLIVLSPCLWALCTNCISSSLEFAADELDFAKSFGLANTLSNNKLMAQAIDRYNPPVTISDLSDSSPSGPSGLLSFYDMHSAALLTVGHRAGSLLTSNILLLVLFLAVSSRSIRSSYLIPLFIIIWITYCITITIGYICVHKANPAVQAVNQFMIYSIAAQFFTITLCILFLSWIATILEAKDREYFYRTTYNIKYEASSKRIRFRASKKLQNLGGSKRRKRQNIISLLNRALILVQEINLSMGVATGASGIDELANGVQLANEFITLDLQQEPLQGEPLQAEPILNESTEGEQLKPPQLESNRPPPVDKYLREITRLLNEILREFGISSSKKSLWFDYYAIEAKRFIERAMVPIYDGRSAGGGSRKKRFNAAAAAAANAAAVAAPTAVELQQISQGRALLPLALHTPNKTLTLNDATVQLEQNVGQNPQFDLCDVIMWIPSILQATGNLLLKDFFADSLNKLDNLLRVIEEGYNPNPYHNWVHGAMVGHIFCSLVNDMECLKPHITSDDYCISIIAALGHDIGHPGRTNVFFTETCDPISYIWSDKSILEMYHICYLSKVLADSGILSNWDKDRQKKAKTRLYDLILATDMADHFAHITKAQNVLNTSTDEETWTMIKLLFKLSDLGHGLLSWNNHYHWSLRIAEEFYQQGDEERKNRLPVTHLCDRTTHYVSFAKGQTSFLTYVLLPVVSLLINLPGRHTKLDQCAYTLLLNAECWASLVNKKDSGFIEKWIAEQPSRLKLLKTVSPDIIILPTVAVDPAQYNLEIPMAVLRMTTNVYGAMLQGVLRLLN